METLRLWALPPSGLSGVPLCLLPGAAGPPLTSRREDLVSRGLLENRLGPLSSPPRGLTPGLSVPLAAPPSCSMPLEMLRGSAGAGFGAGRGKRKTKNTLRQLLSTNALSLHQEQKRTHVKYKPPKGPEIPPDPPDLDGHRYVLNFDGRLRVFIYFTQPDL